MNHHFDDSALSIETGQKVCGICGLDRAAHKLVYSSLTVNGAESKAKHEVDAIMCNRCQRWFYPQDIEAHVKKCEGENMKTIKRVATMRRLPAGSMVRGKVADVAYQIEKIAGYPVIYGAGATFRVGDRITEADAEDISNDQNQDVVMLKGLE